MKSGYTVNWSLWMITAAMNLGKTGDVLYDHALIQLYSTLVELAWWQAETLAADCRLLPRDNNMRLSKLLGMRINMVHFGDIPCN